tara:strand:+ start:2600 stop:3130 length:531 start_codon:yes stop_codon:yes gene_type:complete
MSNSKKTLLSESEIRRFQGLAGLPAIGQMNELEDELEDEMAGAPGELDGELGDLEVDVADDAAELGMPDEGGDENGVAASLSGGEKEELAALVVRAVTQELEGALELEAPIVVDVEGEEAAVEEPPLEGGEEDLDFGAAEELPPEGEEEEELAEVVDDDVVVNEVLRRVIARLAKK